MYDCRNRLIRTGDTTYEYDAENNRTAVTTDDSGQYYMRTTVLYQIEDNVYTSQVYSLKEDKSGDRLRIAVKSSDYYKVSVCTLEPAIFKEVKYKLMMLLAIYIVCIICFNILIYGMKRIIGKMDHRTYEVLGAEKMYKQGIIQDEKKNNKRF